MRDAIKVAIRAFRRDLEDLATEGTNGSANSFLMSAAVFHCGTSKAAEQHDNSAVPLLTNTPRARQSASRHKPDRK